MSEFNFQALDAFQREWLYWPSMVSPSPDRAPEVIEVLTPFIPE